jgi:cbb3-type cytochrome oxidase subunit 3
MEIVRVIFLLISFLTFAAIVFWAFAAPGRRSAANATSALASDDDRAHLNLSSDLKSNAQS